MSVSEIINLRNKLGINQDELADLFGLYGANTISRWEIGYRQPNETVRRLICLLNDLPKKEAEEMLKKLGQYKLKKR